MPSARGALVITPPFIALHGRKSHYKNAEEKNNTGLESSEVVEAVICDSIKGAL